MTTEKRKKLEILFAYDNLYNNVYHNKKISPGEFKAINESRKRNKKPLLREDENILNPKNVCPMYFDNGKFDRADGKSHRKVLKKQIKELQDEEKSAQAKRKTKGNFRTTS